MIDETLLVPVWDQVLGFMDEALLSHEASQTKIADLSQKLVESERLLLEKVASAEKAAKSSVFPEEKLTHAVEHLVNLHILHPQERTKLAAELRADPSQALTLLVKISENLMFPKEGMGIPRAGTDRETDPDGWTDFAEGRPVVVKSK